MYKEMFAQREEIEFSVYFDDNRILCQNEDVKQKDLFIFLETTEQKTWVSSILASSQTCNMFFAHGFYYRELKAGDMYRMKLDACKKQGDASMFDSNHIILKNSKFMFLILS